MRFVDTKVLLYAITPDPGELAKRNRAKELLLSPDLALSAQVLQEFYVQATRASRPDRLSHADAVALIETFLAFEIEDVTPALVFAAAATSERFGISYWDAAII